MFKPLTVPELAEFLDVSESWVAHRCAGRKIPFTKVGRQIRFTEEHIAQILAAGEEPVLRQENPVVHIRARPRRAAA